MSTVKKPSKKLVVRIEKVNFQHLIEELMTYEETSESQLIANAIGASGDIISRLKRGVVKEPRYYVGCALVELRDYLRESIE